MLNLQELKEIYRLKDLKETAGNTHYYAEISRGENIKDTIKNAFDMARILKKPILFEFNNISITVDKDSDLDSIYNNYKIERKKISAIMN